MGLFLRRNQLLRCWGWLSLLIWIGALTLSLLLKLPARKLEPLLVLWSSFSWGSVYLHKSTIQSWMEYFCHIWAGALSCCLHMIDKLQKKICTTVAPSLTGNIDSFVYSWNKTRLSLFYKFYFGRCSYDLAELVLLPHSNGRSTLYYNRLHDFSFTIPWCFKDVYFNSSFPQTARFWSSLPVQFFPLASNYNYFKSWVNTQLFNLGSF